MSGLDPNLRGRMMSANRGEMDDPRLQEYADFKRQRAASGPGYDPQVAEDYRRGGFDLRPPERDYDAVRERYGRLPGVGYDDAYGDFKRGSRYQEGADELTRLRTNLADQDLQQANQAAFDRSQDRWTPAMREKYGYDPGTEPHVSQTERDEGYLRNREWELKRYGQLAIPR